MSRFNFTKSRRFRKGGISVALTSLIVLLLILVNSLFGMLSDRYYWGIDLSGGYFFTLTDYSKELLAESFKSLPDNRRAQNERYEKKNAELIENVNLKIDEVNEALGSEEFNKLTAETYTSDAVRSLNEKIEQLNKANGTQIEEFTYRALTPRAPDDVKVKIIFCDDEDDFEADEMKRYVLETARQLKAQFPSIIELEFVNIYANPSAVSKYKTSTLTEINATDIIVESGNEYRHFPLDSFYIFESSSSNNVWAFNGEKKFASAILAVTQAEAPIAGVLLNHGETFFDDSLLTLLSDAGYIVQGLDLSKDEIPDECRLILCYNPDKDFLSSSDVGVGGRSEITALEQYMKRDNTSFMVFMSPDTPKLKNLEEFLEIWGVTFERNDDISCVVKESLEYSVSADGLSGIAAYVTEQLGGQLTSDMRQVVSPAKVIFRNAMSIKYAENYKLDRGADDVSGTADDRYSASVDGSSYFIYNVFTSSPNASLLAGGKEIGHANAADPYIYMTLSEDSKGYSEQVFTPDGDVFESGETSKTSSYVVTFSSVEFATEKYLESSSYGNSEVLLRTLREMGKDAIPTSLPIKPFEYTAIETMTAKEANTWTLWLALTPAFISAAVGIFVLIRRKNR